MPAFTIETTYHVPFYRLRAYEADAAEQACGLAVGDDDWDDQKHDYEAAGETFVSGIWQGADTAYRGTAVSIPSQFAETNQRKADHFETLLSILKILAHVEDLAATNLPRWVPAAQVAIAKAEAILAGAPDPEGEPIGAPNRVHILIQLEEERVRETIASITETDPTLARLTADAISGADLHSACLAVAAETDLSEERGAAEFRAALAAIREAERRQAASA